jgi:hypothetical protein
MPECRELVLDKIERRERETASSELQSERSDYRAIGRGVRLVVRRLLQMAQLTQRQSGTCTTLDWPNTGKSTPVLYPKPAHSTACWNGSWSR